MRSVVIPGPRRDKDAKAVSQFARAVQEVFAVASRVNIVIHMPMYREPGLDEKADLLTAELEPSEHVATGDGAATTDEIDLFGAWDTWHTIRSVCDYSTRLYVGKCTVALLRSISLSHGPSC